MKTKNLLVIVLFLFLMTGMGCKENNPIVEQSSQFNKNSTYTIFELKYGEDTTITFNNTSIGLSLNNVVDSVLEDCSLAEFENSGDENKIKTHAYLSAGINNTTSIVKVSSKACGALSYNGVSDIEDIKNMIVDWKSAPYENYISEVFLIIFGKPTMISNTSYYINMAKAYPIEYEQVDKGLYKFIFILWTNKF